MGGIRAFERRYAWWIRMRERMSWKHYSSARDIALRKAAAAFLVGFGAVMAIMFLALAIGASAAHAQVPTDAARYRLTLTREARAVWGLNAPIASFAAQVHQESRWNPEATSQVGAQGLAQFMPSTATWISGLYPSLADRAPRNPTWALRALVTYDAQLFTEVRQADDDCQRFAFALSAYNGGIGWVHRRQAKASKPGICFGQACLINPGIKPSAQAENEAYPRHILQRHQALYQDWGPGVCP
jgi:soluble lytic murein transglycosylase-like protein